MAVYAITGIIMIFRGTDFLKKGKLVEKKLTPGLNAEDLGKAIRIGGLIIEAENGDVQTFKQGTYNNVTGDVKYTVKTWPKVIENLTQLHKANTKQPLFYLNVFFGVSLLFLLSGCLWLINILRCWLNPPFDMLRMRVVIIIVKV